MYNIKKPPLSIEPLGSSQFPEKLYMLPHYAYVRPFIYDNVESLIIKLSI